MSAAWEDPEHTPGGWHCEGWRLPPRVPRTVSVLVADAIRAIRATGRDETEDEVNALVERLTPQPTAPHCEMCGTSDARADIHQHRCRRCWRGWRRCADCGRVYPAASEDEDSARCWRCADAW